MESAEDCYTHPITGTKYAKPAREQYVQALIETWKQNSRAEANVKADKALLVKALDEVAEQREIVRGTVRVKGSVEQVKLVRKENASYPRERGEPHPLSVILQDFGDLAPMIRVDYDESGDKIENLVELYATHLDPATGNLKEGIDKVAVFGSETRAMMAKRLYEARVVKPGTPSVEIEDRKDIPLSRRP